MGEGRKRKLSVAVERAVADEAALVLDTFGGKLHVKFDHTASVTMLGQLPFFVEFLQASGLYERWIKSAPLHYNSPNAPSVQDVLGTLFLAALSGMRRYRHINALRADGVSPGLLGMTKIVSDDSLSRALGAMDEAVADQCQFGLRARGAGSVRVRAGANVGVGDWLGSVGNSGNTGEPHLHVHAQRQGPVEAALGGDPRPIQFNGRFPVRGDRIEAP